MMAKKWHIKEKKETLVALKNKDQHFSPFLLQVTLSIMIVMATSAKGASVYKPGMASVILFPI